MKGELKGDNWGSMFKVQAAYRGRLLCFFGPSLRSGGPRHLLVRIRKSRRGTRSENLVYITRTIKRPMFGAWFFNVYHGFTRFRHVFPMFLKDMMCFLSLAEAVWVVPPYPMPHCWLVP